MRLLRWLTFVCGLAFACDALPMLADSVPQSPATIRSTAPSKRTIASLPVCTEAREGFSFKVTDALDATTCSAGGGTNDHVCVCQQGNYIADNPTAGGGGDQLGADVPRGDVTISGGGTVANLNPDSVGAPEIAPDAVGASEIAPGAVGASEAAALDASDTSTGQFADTQISASSVEQHEAALEVEDAGTGCIINKTFKSDGAGGVVCADDSTGGSPTYDTVGDGVSVNKTHTVGNGSSVAPSGTGVVNSNVYSGPALADAQVSGSGESDEVTIGGDANGTASNLQLGAGVVGTSEAAGLDAADTTTGEHPDARVSDTLTVGAASTVAGAAITAGTVGDTALAAAAVDGGTGGEVADDSLTAADIAADAVGASEIAANAVGAPELAPASVEWASEIADDLGCTATQAVRRNALDTAWECYAPSSVGGDVLGPDANRSAFTVSGGGATATLNADVVGGSQIIAGSVGNTDLGTNSIDIAKMQNDSVAAAEIAADAVGASEIAADAVTASEIATDAVGSPEIAADAVTASEIATDAVGAPEVAADAIGSSEIAAGAVGTSEAAALDASDTTTGEFPDALVSDTLTVDNVPIDVTNWGGSDPGGVRDHLEYLAARVRFLVAALSSEWDVVVDATAGIKWVGITPETISNRAQLIQEAINPWSDIDNATSLWRVHVGGVFSLAWADYYDAGPIRFAIALIGSDETPGAGGTGGFSGGGENGWPNPLTTTGYYNATGSITTTTSGSVLTDSLATFGSANAQAARFVEIVTSTAGTCDGNKRRISSSTGTTLTVDTAFSGACTVQAYRIFYVPNINARQLRLDWNVFVTDSDAGQDENGVFIMRGNGWFAGHDGGAVELLGSVHNIHETGTFFYGSTNDVLTSSWAAGRTPEMAAGALLESNRTKLFALDTAIRRSRDEVYRVVVCENGSTISVDDGYLLTAQTWGYMHEGYVRVGNCGFGVKFIDNNIGIWGPHYIAGVNQGISFGEVANDGFVPYSSCLTGYCAPVYTGGAGGSYLESWIIEAAYYGAVDHVDGGAEISHFFAESATPPLWHDTIIGAGKCTSGDSDKLGRYAAESSDCGSGGVATFHATATTPVTYMVYSGLGGANAQSNSHERYRGLIIGSGGNQGKGSVEFGPHVYFGMSVIPANNSLCTGAGTPWFCEGAAANDQVNIGGPAFPMTGAMPTVRVILHNASRLTAEPGAASTPGVTALWPYGQYWTPNHRVSRFLCDGCDANVSDALTRDGGWVADGSLTATTPANAHIITDGFHFAGNLTYSNVFVDKLVCTPGAFAGWGAGETLNLRAFITNGTTSVAVGNAVTITEGVDLPGVPKSNSVGINTNFFDAASGTSKTYAPFALGVFVSSETDSGDDNPLRVECSIDSHMLGND